MASKFYAVRIGKKPGIYTNWNECQEQIKGYPGAIFKSFLTLEEARNFIDNAEKNDNTCIEEELPENYAFVDGSFNQSTGVYGFGGFLVAGSERIVIQGKGMDPEMASMRNISGEILGSQAAIEKALELGLSELSIFYDYAGIEQWASGSWKRNKSGTISYYDFVQSVKNQIKLHFVKVKGHSGIEGNEEADRLAKEAVGII